MLGGAPRGAIVAAALFLLAMFALPCMPGSQATRDCVPQPRGSQFDDRDGTRFSVLCSEAGCTATKTTLPHKPTACGGVICRVSSWAWNYLTRIGEDPIALFTGLLFFSTAGLWWAAVRTLRHADRGLRTVERAFVYVRAYSNAALISASTQQVIGWRIVVEWYNSGKTPARRVHVHASWRAEMTPPDDFPDLWNSNLQIPRVTTYCGPQSVLNSEPLDIPLTEFVRAQAMGGFVYLWGWLDYNDVFERSERHRTEFCIALIPTRDLSTVPTGNEGPPFIYSHYRKHNGTDEQCTRAPAPYLG